MTRFVTNQDQLFIEMRYQLAFQAELYSHHITDCWLCIRNAVRLCVRAHSLFPESEMFSSLTTLTPETLLDTLALLFKGTELSVNHITKHVYWLSVGDRKGGGKLAL